MLYIKLIIKFDKKTNTSQFRLSRTYWNRYKPPCMRTSRHFNLLSKSCKDGMSGEQTWRSFLAICIHLANINYIKHEEGCPCFLMNHFIHLDYRLLISHISSWNYQAVQIIEYNRKAQIQSQEEVIQLVQLILRHRISIGLCNWDRFILIYKLMFPPDLLHRKL